jgi:anti-anti-sigma factor
MKIRARCCREMLELPAHRPYCSSEQRSEVASHNPRRGNEVVTMSVQVPVSSDTLGIVVSRPDGRTVVALTGQLDATTAPKLSVQFATLARGDQVDVELDLSHLENMDASGLSVVVAEHKRVQSDGGVLTILSPNRHVIRLFQLNGLMSYLVVKPRMSV